MNEKQLRAELDAVYRSTSWRMTAPLRAASALVRRTIIHPLSPRRWGPKLVSMLTRYPTLFHSIRRFLARNPRLQMLARRWYHGINRQQIAPVVAPPAEEASPSMGATCLSHSSRVIYDKLKTAVKRGK